ncbi:MAG: hypothetical protein OEX17_04530 [Rhodospirillaceae bacterium]|nr:hypothetical protein [Rhodospirillaceae bacterium]
MAQDATSQEFWTRAEQQLRTRKPTTWWITMFLLRFGILFILFATVYIFFSVLAEPAKGYFFFSAERKLPPILWFLAGTGMIIVGAYIRFQALGSIVERLKSDI